MVSLLLQHSQSDTIIHNITYMCVEIICVFFHKWTTYELLCVHIHVYARSNFVITLFLGSYVVLVLQMGPLLSNNSRVI